MCPMKKRPVRIACAVALTALLCTAAGATLAQSGSRTTAAADCTPAKLGSSIPVAAIGEPVSAVALDAPRWVEAARGLRHIAR